MSEENENLENDLNAPNSNENNEGDINTQPTENNQNLSDENQNNVQNETQIITPVLNLKNLFKNLKKVLSESQDLKTFCVNTFGSIPKIRIGIDVEDMPEAPDGAMICIVSGSRSRTRGEAYHSHSISIIGVVKCITKTQEISQDMDILTLDALGLIDDFINIVEKIVFNNVQEWGVAITPIDGDPDEIIYPYARAELAYRVDIRSLI
jgi:hypothetical protein